MFDRIMSVTLAVLAVCTLGMSYLLVTAVGQLAPRIDAAVEAVNMIEQAARSIEEDMHILRNIADREECYDNRGEWSDEYGCVLEEVQ